MNLYLLILDRKKWIAVLDHSVAPKKIDDEEVYAIKKFKTEVSAKKFIKAENIKRYKIIIDYDATVSGL